MLSLIAGIENYIKTKEFIKTLTEPTISKDIYWVLFNSLTHIRNIRILGFK